MNTQQQATITRLSDAIFELVDTYDYDSVELATDLAQDDGELITLVDNLRVLHDAVTMSLLVPLLGKPHAGMLASLSPQAGNTKAL